MNGSLLGAVPPRPWRVIPSVPGSRSFIRAADDKTVCSEVRNEAIAHLIVTAVNAYEGADRDA